MFEHAQLWPRAAQIYDMLLEANPADTWAMERRIHVAARQGDVGAALRVGEQVVSVWRRLARALAAEGKAEEGAALMRRAIAIDPRLDLHDSLVEIAMPGPFYYQHLAWLHEALRPKTYLEIGVWYGQTLSLAQPPTLALGVDPEPQSPLPIFAADTRVFTVTSDAFFADSLWLPALGPRPFDLVFIDGLHRFEQVLRDFINVERHCTRGSVVVFHDILPLVPVAAERDAAAPFWCGDVWKIAPCLERYRPDLRIATIPTGPSGLGIVTGLDPGSTVLADRFDEAVAEIGALPYAALESRMGELLGAERNRRETVIEALERVMQ